MNRACTTARRDARLVPMSSLGDGDDGPDLDDHHRRGRGAIPPATWPDDDPARLIERRQLRAVIDQALETLPRRGSGRSSSCAISTAGRPRRSVTRSDLTETNQRVLLHCARAPACAPRSRSR